LKSDFAILVKVVNIELVFGHIAGSDFKCDIDIRVRQESSELVFELLDKEAALNELVPGEELFQEEAVRLEIVIVKLFVFDIEVPGFEGFFRKAKDGGHFIARVGGGVLLTIPS
jgi:hypothetical protein